MNRIAHRLLTIWNWSSLAALIVGFTWLVMLNISGPGPVPWREVTFVTAVISVPGPPARRRLLRVSARATR